MTYKDDDRDDRSQADIIFYDFFFGTMETLETPESTRVCGSCTTFDFGLKFCKLSSQREFCYESSYGIKKITITVRISLKFLSLNFKYFSHKGRLRCP